MIATDYCCSSLPRAYWRMLPADCALTSPHYDGYLDFDIDGAILLPETKMDGDDYKNEGLFKDNRQTKTK